MKDTRYLAAGRQGPLSQLSPWVRTASKPPPLWSRSCCNWWSQVQPKSGRAQSPAAVEQEKETLLQVRHLKMFDLIRQLFWWSKGLVQSLVQKFFLDPKGLFSLITKVYLLVRVWQFFEISFNRCINERDKQMTDKIHTDLQKNRCRNKNAKNYIKLKVDI